MHFPSCRAPACLWLLSSLLAGCPSASAPDAPVGDDVPSADAPASHDVPADVVTPEDVTVFDDAFDAFAPPDDGLVEPCAYVDVLDRSCIDDTDCAFGVHQSDCCGTSVVLGFAAGERSRFEALEPACVESHPLCGCAARPTTAESGETVTDVSAVQVACVSRGPRSVCISYVTMRPPDAD